MSGEEIREMIRSEIREAIRQDRELTVRETLQRFGLDMKSNDDWISQNKADQIIGRHEMIHARQQLEMLILFFYLWYLVEWLIRLVINFKMAYMSVSFEREAYRNDENSEYLAGRKYFAWLSYLRQEKRFKVKIYYTSGRELIRLRNANKQPN